MTKGLEIKHDRGSFFFYNQNNLPQIRQLSCKLTGETSQNNKVVQPFNSFLVPLPQKAAENGLVVSEFVGNEVTMVRKGWGVITWVLEFEKGFILEQREQLLPSSVQDLQRLEIWRPSAASQTFVLGISSGGVHLILLDSEFQTLQTIQPQASGKLTTIQTCPQQHLVLISTDHSEHLWFGTNWSNDSGPSLTFIGSSYSSLFCPLSSTLSPTTGLLTHSFPRNIIHTYFPGSLQPSFSIELTDLSGESVLRLCESPFMFVLTYFRTEMETYLPNNERIASLRIPQGIADVVTFTIKSGLQRALVLHADRMSAQVVSLPFLKPKLTVASQAGPVSSCHISSEGVALLQGSSALQIASLVPNSLSFP
jgi:hypothetical protein